MANEHQMRAKSFLDSNYRPCTSDGLSFLLQPTVKGSIDDFHFGRDWRDVPPFLHQRPNRWRAQGNSSGGFVVFDVRKVERRTNHPQLGPLVAESRRRESETKEGFCGQNVCHNGGHFAIEMSKMGVVLSAAKPSIVD